MVYAKQGLRSEVENKCAEIKINYSCTDLSRDIFSELILIYLYDFADYYAAKKSYEEFKLQYDGDPLIEELTYILEDWQNIGLFRKPDLPESNDYINIPSNFILNQNYPNPFNPQTIIRYALPVDSHVRLDVYNMLGQRVKRLVKGKQTVGYKQVLWDGTDERGNTVGNGVYIYCIQVGDFIQAKKMALVR